MTPDPDPIDLTPAEVYHPAPLTPADPPGFDDLAAGAANRPPRPAEPAAYPWRVWLAVGVFLQVLAAGLWYFYAFRD